MAKYTLQNIGRPQTSVVADDWKDLSKHASENAARAEISRRTAHLSPGSWDDHYRVLDPNGNVCDKDEWFAREYVKHADNRR